MNSSPIHSNPGLVAAFGAFICSGEVLRKLQEAVKDALTKGLSHNRKKLEAALEESIKQAKEIEVPNDLPLHINTSERLFDLVRFLRQDLHEAELISDEEYFWLCSGPMATSHSGGSPSRGRLESYDDMRERLDLTEKVVEAARVAEKRLLHIVGAFMNPAHDGSESDVFAAISEVDINSPSLGKALWSLDQGQKQSVLKPEALKAEWRNDCQGKKDYDATLLKLSSRFYPRGGGFSMLDTSSGHWEENCERPEIKPSASASILMQGTTIAEAEFTADTEEEVMRLVEEWGEASFKLVQASLLKTTAFKLPVTSEQP